MDKVIELLKQESDRVEYNIKKLEDKNLDSETLRQECAYSSMLYIAIGILKYYKK